MYKMKAVSYNSKKCIINNHSYYMHTPFILHMWPLYFRQEVTAPNSGLLRSYSISRSLLICFFKCLAIGLLLTASQKIQNRKSSYHKSNFLAASSPDIRLVHLVVSLLNANSTHSVATHGNMKHFPYCPMRGCKTHTAALNEQVKGCQSHKHPETLKTKDPVFTADKPMVPVHSGNAGRDCLISLVPWRNTSPPTHSQTSPLATPVHAPKKPTDPGRGIQPL